MNRIERRDFLRAAAAAAVSGACPRGWARQLGDDAASRKSEATGWAALPGILAKIVPPKFPARDFVITEYGASGGDCAPAIAAAISACNRAGGGRVVIPAGEWLCDGPIRLLSNVNLYLEQGSLVIFGFTPEKYLPLQLVRWQGVRCYNYSPLIHAYQQKNIALTGSGTLNGQGSFTWGAWVDKGGPDVQMLYRMGIESIPLEDRIFGAGHFLRPAFFEPYRCQNILVQGVQFVDSPFWTMHPTFCTNVTIQDVTVNRGAENDDGCDPDSCVNVLVEGCSFDTVDDNVSIKAGQLPDAAGLGDCENIVFRNCTCVRSAYSGLTIGSQAGAVVRNVFIENCTVSNVINAHYLKTHGNWGGGIENVYIRSNHVYNCNTLLALQPDLYLDQPVIGPPVFANINMQDVTCESARDVPFLFEGDPRKPIDGVNLSNITVSSRAKDPASVSNTVKLSATDITLNGKPVKIEA